MQANIPVIKDSTDSEIKDYISNLAWILKMDKKQFSNKRWKCKKRLKETLFFLSNETETIDRYDLYILISCSNLFEDISLLHQILSLDCVASFINWDRTLILELMKSKNIEWFETVNWIKEQVSLILFENLEAQHIKQRDRWERLAELQKLSQDPEKLPVVKKEFETYIKSKEYKWLHHLNPAMMQNGVSICLKLNSQRLLYDFICSEPFINTKIIRIETAIAICEYLKRKWWEDLLDIISNYPSYRYCMDRIKDHFRRNGLEIMTQSNLAKLHRALQEWWETWEIWENSTLYDKIQKELKREVKKRGNNT